VIRLKGGSELGNCDVKEYLVHKTDVGNTAKMCRFWVESCECGVVASAVVIKLVLLQKTNLGSTLPGE
jgi:hypothetical protein